jgi:hypothetical protein
MPVVPALVTAAGAIASAKIAGDAQKKAAAKAAKAGQASQVDPDRIATLAENQAARNVAKSLALEGQYAPDQQAFRNESVSQLLQRLRSGDAYTDQALGSMSDQLQQGDLGTTRSQLLTDAIAKAAADLQQGGNLDVATRNEVTRKALGQAGAVGGGRLGLGRTITARDLGLRSMDVANDRLARAAQLGQIEQSANQTDTQTALANRSLRAQLAQALQAGSNSRTATQMGLAQLGQSFQPPVAGLDPGSYVDIFTNNASNASQAGMNQALLKAQAGRDNAQMIGSIAGAASKIEWGKIFGKG